MTVAQIVLLAEVHWPAADTGTAGRRTRAEDLGTIDDLMRLARAQK